MSVSAGARGRKWTEVSEEFASTVRAYLVKEGGIDVGDAVGPAEVWRVKFSDATFTYYKAGTLYSTPSLDPAVEDAWKLVDLGTEPPFVPSDREFLIGLDETGKGELVGHTVLVGVILPRTLVDEVVRIVGLAETKRKKTIGYWDQLFMELDRLKPRGLHFIIEKVPPWHVDRYNINRLLDVTYQRILNVFLRGADPAACRIVADNYGVGPALDRFLRALRNAGAEVVVESGADDRYLEARTASVLAKREREKVMEAINRSSGWQIDGLSIGSGNAGNAQTLDWLKRWKGSGKDWPWFIKRSFSTVASMDGLTYKKQEPPIRDELLSEEFKEEFDQGRLSVTTLSVVCPSCGMVSRAVLLALDTKGWTSARCLECKALLPDLGFTLRYYCGFVVPDSNVINSGLVSKDLASPVRFFEGFTLLLPAVVRAECETRGGEKELERIANFAAMGRIDFQNVGSVRGERETSIQRDELVLDAAVENNAMLMTGDRNLRAVAQGKQLFTLATKVVSRGPGPSEQSPSLLGRP